MPKLKFLKVQFDTQIEPYEIPAFRGAMIAKVGKENTLLFHNHIDEQKYHYAYPLVQYKTIYRRPTLVCLGEGVEVVHKFFEQQNWDLLIGEQMHKMPIHTLDMNQFMVQVWDKNFEYQIRNWLPITQSSHKEYGELEGMIDKIAFLEKKMVGHLLAFAKGISWKVAEQIEVKITDYQEPHLAKHKGVKLLAFNLKFKSNIFLPNYLGLGKGTSVGFGTVREVR